MNGMKAILIEQYGSADVLQYTDVPIPEITSGEVLIEVKACGVNYADTTKRRGGGGVHQTALPWIPGSEVSGIVIKVGSTVSHVSVGDRVVAVVQDVGGGYARYCKANASRVVQIPDDLPFVDAAAIPVQGLTAYHVLTTQGRLQKGESVLIHAAAGGVGTLAIQLAKYMGPGKIIAAASTDEKLELANSLGADVVVNYSEDSWIQQVLEHTDGKGVDLILESIGGQFRIDNLNCLSTFGRLVTYGSASRSSVDVNPGPLIAKCQSLTGFLLGKVTERKELFFESLEKIIELAAQGIVKPVIGSLQPLHKAAEQHRLLEQRQTTGKVILLPWEE
jgi:NADPH:quinone reductase